MNVTAFQTIASARGACVRVAVFGDRMPAGVWCFADHGLWSQTKHSPGGSDG